VYCPRILCGVGLVSNMADGRVHAGVDDKDPSGLEVSKVCTGAYARLCFLLCHAGKKGREGPGYVPSGVLEYRKRCNVT